jgi:hypothetical protein
MVKGRCRVGNVQSLLTNAEEKERSGVFGITSRVFIHVTQSCHLHLGRALAHPTAHQLGKSGASKFPIDREAGVLFTEWLNEALPQPNAASHLKAHQIWAINNQSLKASILEATETSELVCSMSSTAEYRTDRSLGSPYGERYHTASASEVSQPEYLVER